MASKTWGPGVIIDSDWLQDTDDIVYGLPSSLDGEGAGLVHAERGQDFDFGTVGFLLIKNGDPVNVFKAFPSKAEVEASQAKTTTTDHQSILADLLGNERSVFFPRGRFNGSAGISITSQLNITADRGAELRFVDGAYEALRFTGGSAGQSSINSLYIRGTNTTSPSITLVKTDTGCAYFTLQGCKLAYADKLFSSDGGYIIKVLNNEMSNANSFVEFDDATGSTADLLTHGNTYGTSNIGGGAIVSVACPGYRSVGDYWETQRQSKIALDLLSGAQRAVVTGAQFENSGGIAVGTSVEAHLNVMALDSWDSIANRFIYSAGGANTYVIGGYLRLTSGNPGVALATGIYGSGGIFVGDNVDIDRWLVGIHAASSGRIGGAQVRRCTTGVNITNGSTVVLSEDLVYSSNTTDLTNLGNTAGAPSTFNLTLTGCTTSPTATTRGRVTNDEIALDIAGVSATSNTTACTLTGVPAAYRPDATYFGSAILVLDNGVQSVEQCTLDASGVLTLYKNGSTTGFTNSGTKGIRACQVRFRRRNV